MVFILHVSEVVNPGRLSPDLRCRLLCKNLVNLAKNRKISTFFMLTVPTEFRRHERSTADNVMDKNCYLNNAECSIMFSTRPVDIVTG